MDMLSRELDIEFREEIYRLKFGVVCTYLVLMD